MDTKEKVILGISAAAIAGVIGYVIYKSTQDAVEGGEGESAANLDSNALPTRTDSEGNPLTIATPPTDATKELVKKAAAKNGITATDEEINQVALMLTSQKGTDNRRPPTANESKLFGFAVLFKGQLADQGKTVAQLKEEAKKVTAGRGADGSVSWRNCHGVMA